MIPYMDLNEQVDRDFSRARGRALMRRVLFRFGGRAALNRLLCFDGERGALRANNRLYLGTRVMKVNRIVGSVGRRRDFDRLFLPVRASVRERWKLVDRAFHRGEDLPPVELYKIGDAYFVLDGHHRVSMARYHSVPTVEAVVTEFRPAPPPHRRPLQVSETTGINRDISGQRPP